MDMIIRRTRISDEQPLMDIGITDGRIAAIEEAIEQAGRSGDRRRGAGRASGLHRTASPSRKGLPASPASAALRHPRGSHSPYRHPEIQAGKQDVLDRSRQVLDMAVKNGTVFVRAHPDVDPIQGLIGVETALLLKDEYRDLLDLQIVAFPQEGWLKTSGVQELMEQALATGRRRRRRLPLQRTELGRHQQPHRQGFRPRPETQSRRRHACRLRR